MVEVFILVAYNALSEGCFDVVEVYLVEEIYHYHC
jgi:hypothetical protein